MKIDNVTRVITFVYISLKNLKKIRTEMHINLYTYIYMYMYINMQDIVE